MLTSAKASNASHRTPAWRVQAIGGTTHRNTMDTLQNMRVFVRVVDAGSFTLAAQQMELTTAHVSRAVADLERHLRTRLLNRTTRRLALTEAGERYLLRCQQIMSYVEE